MDCCSYEGFCSVCLGFIDTCSVSFQALHMAKGDDGVVNIYFKVVFGARSK